MEIDRAISNNYVLNFPCDCQLRGILKLVYLLADRFHGGTQLRVAWNIGSAQASLPNA